MELANGDMPQLGLYINRLIKTQDLEAWKADPAKFNAWIKQCICDYVQGIQFSIVTYAARSEAAFEVVMVKDNKTLSR